MRRSLLSAVVAVASTMTVGAAHAQPWQLGGHSIAVIAQPPTVVPGATSLACGGVFTAGGPTLFRDVYIADDWQASATLPVSQVDVWVAWKDDYAPWTAGMVGTAFQHGVWIVSIYSNASGPWGDGPGALLWTREFHPGGYTATLFGAAMTTLFDPFQGIAQGSGTETWQYTFGVSVGAFVQQDGDKYWLSIHNYDPWYDGIQNLSDYVLAAAWRRASTAYRGDAFYAAPAEQPGLPPAYSTPPAGVEFQPVPAGGGINVAFVLSSPGEPCEDAPPCSPADLTRGAFPGVICYGEPNGVLNSEDFFYYLAQYGNANVAVADLTTTANAGQAGYGVPNGILNSEDYFYYLTLYALGC